MLMTVPSSPQETKCAFTTDGINTTPNTRSEKRPNLHGERQGQKQPQLFWQMPSVNIEGSYSYPVDLMRLGTFGVV